MSLQLVRRLVGWATCSLALVLVLYAPLELRTWSDSEGRWVRSEYKTRNLNHRRGRNSRRFLIELLAVQQEEFPDWLRMAEEVGLELAIGGGLLLALRPGKQGHVQPESLKHSAD